MARSLHLGSVQGYVELGRSEAEGSQRSKGGAHGRRGFAGFKSWVSYVAVVSFVEPLLVFCVCLLQGGICSSLSEALVYVYHICMTFFTVLAFW